VYALPIPLVVHRLFSRRGAQEAIPESTDRCVRYRGGASVQHLLILPAQWQSLRMRHLLAEWSSAHLAMATVLATIDAGGGGPPGSI
jgi:hypothetical protein